MKDRLDNTSSQELDGYRDFLRKADPLRVQRYKKGMDTSNVYSQEALVDGLADKVLEILAKQERVKVLDIGAGRQPIEKQFSERIEGSGYEEKVQIISIDRINVAKLNKEGLNTEGTVIADALKLPFKDKSFDIIVSNLAIDGLPESALAEAYRVLKSGGAVIFNFHWLKMSGINESFSSASKEYLKQESIGGVDLSKEEIIQKFEKHGFKEVEVENIGYSQVDCYWREVTATKK